MNATTNTTTLSALIRSRVVSITSFLPPLFLISLLSLAAYAEETALIRMKTSQQQALGITDQPLTPVKNAWNTAYPAKVMVPNAQLRVVSAPLGGLLESLRVAEGETVNEGQTLAVIHSPQLLEQQSAYLEALTELNLATTQKKRDAQLSREGIIAKRRFLESRAKHTQANTRVEQYRQALLLSGMTQRTLAQLERTHRLSPSLSVTAPLSGVVLEQLTTPGSQLDALDPLYKIGHLQPLWLEIHVPLDQLGDIHKGTLVRVIKPAVSGKVITVGRMVHGADQGVLVRAEIHKGTEQLRPGQFVQAQIAQPQSNTRPSYRIPRSALVRNAGKTWVFVSKPRGFLPVPVELIKEESTALVIHAPLSANASIVVTGTAALKAAWLGGDE